MRKTIFSSRITLIALAVLIAALAATVFFVTQDADRLRDAVRGVLETARASGWSYPIVCGLYVLSSTVMFPIIVMNLATAMVFGPVYGFLYAMSGTLLSGTIFFFIGRFGRDRGLKRLLSGKKLSTLDRKLGEAGIIGVATLRLVPLAPFGIFNMVAGITSLRFVDYFIGTFIAFWPGGIARALVGDSLVELFLHPDRKSFLYLLCGVAVWIAIILSLHFGLRKYRRASA